MIGGYFRRTIDDRRTKLQHLWFGKGLKDKLISNAVGISVCYCYADSFIIVHILISCIVLLYSVSYWLSVCSLLVFLRSYFLPFYFFPLPLSSSIFFAVESRPQAAKISCPRLARIVVKTPCCVR